MRASLLDLLIELRKIKAMHWHNFVGKEELLRRLPLEGKANQQRYDGTRLGHGRLTQLRRSSRVSLYRAPLR